MLSEKVAARAQTVRYCQSGHTLPLLADQLERLLSCLAQRCIDTRGSTEGLSAVCGQQHSREQVAGQLVQANRGLVHSISFLDHTV